jgi:Mitochondrial carrier protein
MQKGFEKNINGLAKKTTAQSSSLDHIISLITSATISGIPADIFSFPACRVKTVMMTQVGKAAQFTNTYQTVSYIYKNQGLSGFYRGFAPLLVSSIPGTALFFGGVQTTQSLLGDSAFSGAVAGFVGQISGSIVWGPAEILKELRQITTTTGFQNKSVTELTKHIYKQEGIRGLYRGTVPQFFAFGTFNSIGLSMSVALHKNINKEELTAAHSMVINGLSFGTGALVTTPIDVVKTRIQVAVADPALFPYRSIWGCTKNIIKNEGVPALLSGTTNRVAWLGSRQAIAFTLFGKVDQACKGYLSEKKENLRLS